MPPVLIDIGASGALPKEWKLLASYSSCIAFDPDEREMAFIEERKSDFKKLVVINRIVLDTNAAEHEFYLTSSPYCSSVFRPDSQSLSDWSFRDLFKVERKISMKSIHLANALRQANVDHIDWFKTDTQGLDLRLFASIGDMQYKVLVFDCEPGFIDAYEGEEKISEMLAYLDKLPFWLSKFESKGTKRANSDLLKSGFSETELRNLGARSTDAACWAEMTFLNNFKDTSRFTTREYLLGIVFSLILKHYAFAGELAIKGKTSDPGNSIFDDIISALKDPANVPDSRRKVTLLQRALRKVARGLNRLAE